MSDEKKLYNQVSPHDLEPEYTQHVMAMTSEKLHYKADIAMELAYRDKQIDALEQRLAAAEAEKQQAIDAALERVSRYLHEEHGYTGASDVVDEFIGTNPLADLQQKNLDLARHNMGLRDRLAELECELAEARKDAERLEWMAKHYDYVMYTPDRNSTMRQMLDPSGSGNLRKAIDAAMRQEEE